MDEIDGDEKVSLHLSESEGRDLIARCGGRAKVSPSPAARFIEDCHRAEVECARRRIENPMVPITGPKREQEPLRITHDYSGRTQQQILEELAMIRHAEREQEAKR